MVTSAKFNDSVFSGETPGNPNSAHGGLSTGTDKPHPFHRRKGLTNQFGKLNLMGVAGAETGPFFNGSMYVFIQAVMGVAKNNGPPGRYIVKIGVSVNIEKVCSFSASNIERLASYGPEGRTGLFTPAVSVFCAAL
jgi:hypothetical protein